MQFDLEKRVGQAFLDFGSGFKLQVYPLVERGNLTLHAFLIKLVHLLDRKAVFSEGCPLPLASTCNTLSVQAQDQQVTVSVRVMMVGRRKFTTDRATFRAQLLQFLDHYSAYVMERDDLFRYYFSHFTYWQPLRLLRCYRSLLAKRQSMIPVVAVMTDWLDARLVSTMHSSS